MPMRASRASVVCLALLLAAFAWGVGKLLDLRYQVGDVYPPYSSLRADPLGTKVLHDALERLPGLSVRRNLLALPGLERPGETALLLLGEAPLLDVQDPSTLDGLESIALHGGRVVVALLPEAQSGWEREYEKEKRRLEEKKEKEGGAGKGESRKKGPPGPGRKPDEPPAGQEAPTPEERARAAAAARRLSRMKRWGYGSRFDPLPVDDTGGVAGTTVRLVAPLPLPRNLPWRTETVFCNLDPAWKIIYARGENPVVIERELGRGRIVLSSDVSLLANQALLEERRTPFLSWLLGARKIVVFDETHLGIEERAGAMTLARRYRLGGLLFALLLAAALFLWKAMTPLVPPLAAEGDPENGAVLGKDAAAGFASLLQRGIPRREILRVCVDEWAKSLEDDRPAHRAIAERLAAEASDPVDGYRSIGRALARTKFHSIPIPERRS
jgi:uncharacterized protein DUF4350